MINIAAFYGKTFARSSLRFDVYSRKVLKIN